MSNSVTTLLAEYNEASNTHKYLTRRNGANKQKAVNFFKWYVDTGKVHTRDFPDDFIQMDWMVWKKTGKGLNINNRTPGEIMAEFYCVMNEL